MKVFLFLLVMLLVSGYDDVRSWDTGRASCRSIAFQWPRSVLGTQVFIHCKVHEE